MEFSLPNIASANALESSVLPTPVGPRNKKEPIGLLGSFNPTRPLRIALDTAVTASSCPITLSCKIFSKFLNLSVSSSANFLTGILVQLEIISAISFSPTTNSLACFSFSVCTFNMLILFVISSCCFLISPAFS